GIRIHLINLIDIYHLLGRKLFKSLFLSISTKKHYMNCDIPSVIIIREFFFATSADLLLWLGLLSLQYL
ncbi:hypothetical protein ACJX0J_041193, partial [Zea mays]